MSEREWACLKHLRERVGGWGEGGDKEKYSEDSYQVSVKLTDALFCLTGKGYRIKNVVLGFLYTT